MYSCEHIVINKLQERLENFFTLIKKYLSANYRKHTQNQQTTVNIPEFTQHLTEL